MKTQSKILMLVAGATLSLSACSGYGFVPANQTPRPYTAAHDIIDGECHTVSARSTTGNVVDHAVPSGATVVRCPQEAGGVEDAGGVQAAR